jgi:hypothetical protein
MENRRLRPEEHRMLQDACRAAAEADPQLQRDLGETSNLSANSIETELSGFLGAVRKDRQRISKSAEAKLQPRMFLYDLALLQICDMSYVGLRNSDHRSKIIWPDLSLPKRPPPNAVFYVLASNLAQSMQAFQLLILHGFESQARAAFRGVVEIADLMIAVLARESTYLEYTKSFEDPKVSYKHWRTHLSPSVVREFVLALEVDDPITIPIDMTPLEIRRDNYSWLSKFVHVDYAAHVVAAHPPDEGDTFGKLAMLGNVGDMSKATLAHALVYLWITLLRIEHLLFEKHSWGRFRGERSRKWFHYRFRVVDNAFLSYLPTYWEQPKQ